LSILPGGVGALALAPLCRMPRNAPLEDVLPDVLETLVRHLNQETSPEVASKILTGAYILAGLKMSRDEARQLFLRVPAVQESTTYQGLLQDRLDEALKILTMLGHEFLGAPSAAIEAQLKAITDVDRLERLCKAAPRARSWKLLLATS
jgi:hypothetical protein